MDELSNIKDKIRKMVALGAEGSGASEDEAATAMRMAMGLMAKHGIDQASIGGPKPSAKMATGIKVREYPSRHATLNAARYLLSTEDVPFIVIEGKKRNDQSSLDRIHANISRLGCARRDSP